MTNSYTYQMTKLAIIAAAAVVALALMMPTSAHAKAKGDTIGAPTKTETTGASRADMADATSTPPATVDEPAMPDAYYYEAPREVHPQTIEDVTIPQATTTVTVVQTQLVPVYVPIAAPDAPPTRAKVAARIQTATVIQADATSTPDAIATTTPPATEWRIITMLKSGLARLHAFINLLLK